MFYLRMLTVTVIICLFTTFASAKPRVAVWDPQRSVTHNRFTINSLYYHQVAKWLENAGISTQRLTAEQMHDKAAFNAERFDAVMIQGDVVPSINLDDFKRFTDDGGVLIALSAPNAFEIKIAQNDDGIWHLDPETTKGYTWQTKTLQEHMGIEFDWRTNMARSSVLHTVMPIITKYLPQTAEFAIPNVGLYNRWFHARSGKIIPLIRSQIATGPDYTPQLYLVINGKRKAIISASTIWTGQQDTATWPYGPQTIVALANLSEDIKNNKVDLAQQLSIDTPKEAIEPGVLQSRIAMGKGIDPQAAASLARWGQFDGSRIELGDPLEANQKRSLKAGGDLASCPQSLAAGAQLVIPLPQIPQGQQLYLRLRGAVDDGGAVLSVMQAERPIWDEMLMYRDSSDGANLGIRYKGAVWEWTRIIYLPLENATMPLTLENKGKTIMYLDAIQLETHQQDQPTVELGAHTGVGVAYDYKTALTHDMIKDLSSLRCTTRTWWVGAPDDPDRWAKFDKHVQRYLALHDRTQFILEGTPPWAPISQDRHDAGGKRAHATPPDLEKFSEITRRIVQTYADRVQDWELWNEANIGYFFTGTPDEYADLFLALEPIVREYDPKARVIIAGEAGTTIRDMDPFAQTMVRRGVTKKADLYAMHVYGGAGLWDVPYGLVQGHLMAAGSPIEIFTNEQGYVFKKEGSFNFGQSVYSEECQAQFINIGMARLMASGVAKVTLFNAGGDTNTFGVIDENGKPRPAWHVYEDYLKLVRKPARRMDVAMTRDDNKPSDGIYIAAAKHEDDSATLVLNPAEVAQFQDKPDPSNKFNADERGLWSCFWGYANWNTDGLVTVKPAKDKSYCGFFRRVDMNLNDYAKITVNIPEVNGKWSLQLKKGATVLVDVFSEETAGTFTFDMNQLGKELITDNLEISFRVYGTDNKVTIDDLTFEAKPGAQNKSAGSIPMTLHLPMTFNKDRSVKATCMGQPIEVASKVDVDGKGTVLQLSMTGRTIITLD